MIFSNDIEQGSVTNGAMVIEGDKWVMPRNHLACAVDLEWGPDREHVRDETIRSHVIQAKPYIDEVRKQLGEARFQEHWGNAAYLANKYLSD